MARAVLRAVVLAGAAGAAYLAISLFDGPAYADQNPLGPPDRPPVVGGLLGEVGGAVSRAPADVLSTSDSDRPRRDRTAPARRDEPARRVGQPVRPVREARAVRPVAEKATKVTQVTKVAENTIRTRGTTARTTARTTAKTTTSVAPESFGVTRLVDDTVRHAGRTPVREPVLKPVLRPVLDPVLRPVLDPVLRPVLDPILEPLLDAVRTHRTVIVIGLVDRVSVVVQPTSTIPVVELAAGGLVLPLTGDSVPAALATGDAEAALASPVTVDNRDPPPGRAASGERTATGVALRFARAGPGIRRLVEVTAGRAVPDLLSHSPGGTPDRRPVAPESVAGGNLRAGGEAAAARPAVAGRSWWQPELAAAGIALPADPTWAGRSAETDSPSG